MRCALADTLNLSEYLFVTRQPTLRRRVFCFPETAMNELIQQKLTEIERDRGVRVLYACESGSRAWGFPSPDSDWDVRFIYVERPEWYVTVTPRRDFIEMPINDALDISGWELRKALNLMRKSNPPLLEWLDSSIVYQQDDAFVAAIRELVPLYFSPKS